MAVSNRRRKDVLLSMYELVMASGQWINVEVCTKWHKNMALAVKCLVSARRKEAKFKSVVVLKIQMNSWNKQTDKIRCKHVNVERRRKDIFLWLTQKKKHSAIIVGQNKGKQLILRRRLTFQSLLVACTNRFKIDIPPTLYLCVLYLSENKQRLVPLTA